MVILIISTTPVDFLSNDFLSNTIYANDKKIIQKC